MDTLSRSLLVLENYIIFKSNFREKYHIPTFTGKRKVEYLVDKVGVSQGEVARHWPGAAF